MDMLCQQYVFHYFSYKNFVKKGFFFFFFFTKLFSPDNYLRLELVENNKKNKNEHKYFFLSNPFCLFYLYIYIYIYIYILVGRMFANSPGDWISIPGRVIPKTQKMVLDTLLLNAAL